MVVGNDNEFIEFFTVLGDLVDARLQAILIPGKPTEGEGSVWLTSLLR
jgi:hypothetical protein